ncbi:hypothetical protein N789_08355 [Arenimonas oryziterrae DSM 21050 = YC6267]|uniref:Beta propeller domain-containing protein n=1 Tax=Arenimonas oryziterrae DSM 21050 = YC6267 TaxID=1121015 RepID=A0A091AX26_9GAMM|nr:hypothetical protein N789_08355 [Arenimonas oryziterrae DSM 21050 = YC6267]
MKNWLVSVLLATAALLPSASAAQAQTLPAFTSETEFQAYLGRLQREDQAKRKADEAKRKQKAAMPVSAPTASPDVSSVESNTILTEAQIDRIPVGKNVTSLALLAPGTTGSDEGESDNITNVQTAGVDEGGIVKKLGEFLIVLRRGHLFSLHATDSDLRAVSTINAYGPDISPDDSWYDEMLVSGRTIVVVGYSYDRGGTELGIFDIDDAGVLSYRATHQLRSNDYYSARNYASRLVGKTLIFYSPLSLDVYAPANESLPAVRHWDSAGGNVPFERSLPATRIYRSGYDHLSDPTLHTVTRCEIGAGRALDCASTAVIGSWGSEFYVSENAVYVWTMQDEGETTTNDRARSSVLRLPLDGSAPAALRVEGSPIDQLSFLERDGYLNVLINGDGVGGRMWSSLRTPEDLALLRVPLTAFGGTRARAGRSAYRDLPTFGGRWLPEQNRYIGDWLLYGSESERSPLTAVRFAQNRPVIRRELGHGTERIEAMGDDAVVVGSQSKDLVFTSLDLDADVRIASRFVQKDSAQSDSRTHGFFYRPTGPDEGLLGLPILGREPRTASVKFLRNQALTLGDLGALVAASAKPADDDCQASCVDWYGNARPIFAGERVYALMGYELVEGALRDGRITERRRIDFAPKAVKAAK